MRQPLAFAKTRPIRVLPAILLGFWGCHSPPPDSHSPLPPSAHTQPTTSAVAIEPVVEPSPEASSEPAPSVLASSAAPTRAPTSPPAWVIGREDYQFYGYPEYPPSGVCAVLADARRLRKHRPRWARSLKAEQCVVAGEDRAWAILRAAKGRWAAAHVTPDRITVGPWERVYWPPGERNLTLFAPKDDELPEALFDYDGDGVPEFLHGKYLIDPGSGGTAIIYGELWTYRAGKVIHYPGVPAGIRLARDVDGDGRPDLLFSPFRGKLSFTLCDLVFDANAYNDEALFAAHSLADGTFSSTDEVAIAHARTWCPQPPDLATLTDPVDSVYERFPCARAWGIEAPELAPLIDAYCQQEIARCPSKQCVDRSVLRGWGQVRAPVLLKP